VLRAEIEAMQDGIRPLNASGLALLHSEVGALTQLVNDLHELALADVGALSYRKQDLDLCALVRHMAQTEQVRLEAAGLAFTFSVPATALTLQADPDRLRQLLRNLFDNAARYTDAPGLITLQLIASGDTAVLLLQDSPPGVPIEQLPRLFDRFFRVEASRGRAGGGSGLGLSICQRIAQAHGGTLRAEPSPLGGLQLTLTLPLLQAGSVPGAPRDDTAPSRPHCGPVP
jgi:two-component system sensor histidine kinase BaeS